MYMRARRAAVRRLRSTIEAELFAADTRGTQMGVLSACQGDASERLAYLGADRAHDLAASSSITPHRGDRPMNDSAEEHS